MGKINGAVYVKYILSKYGPLPQKKLQKLAYITEFEYIKKHGERLSDLSYKHYYYGPYSEDIPKIEDLDENIMVVERQEGGYFLKEAEYINKDEEIAISKEIANEIDTIIKKYSNKNGKELEVLADETDPFLEAKNLNDKINLDDFAWYYKIINSKEFWEQIEKKDEKNRKNGVYGKHLIDHDCELEDLF
jgi:uncharacterized phage-associated protein